MARMFLRLAGQPAGPAAALPAEPAAALPVLLCVLAGLGSALRNLRRQNPQQKGPRAWQPI
jgi:hypothetical protein